MFVFLTVVSGLAWTLVYFEAIRLGFKQRTYAMPIAALGLNIAWETIYSVYSFSQGVSIQGFINVIWALMDMVIVYTFFRYGRGEFPKFLSRGMFVLLGIGTIAISYVIQWLFIVEFGWYDAPRYSAFLQNVLMSGLFIAMFIARRGMRGQSVTLGVAKWIGTLAPTFAFGIVEGFNPLLLGLGVLCSVLDLTYIGMLLWGRRHQEALSR